MSLLSLKRSVELRQGSSSTVLFDRETGRQLPVSADEAWVLSLLEDGTSPEGVTHEARRRGRPVDADLVDAILERFLGEGVLSRADEPVTVVVDPSILKPSAPHAPKAPAGKTRQVTAFRSDLKIAKTTRGDETLHEVEDPGTGRRLYLKDFELSIARMLDGQRTFDQVLHAAARLGIQVNDESLEKIVRQLELCGLLGQRPREEGAPPTDSRSWQPREAWAQEVRELFQDGLRMLRRGKPRSARNCFLAILKLDPGNVEANELLGFLDEQVAEEVADADDQPDQDVNVEEVDAEESAPSPEEEETPRRRGGKWLFGLGVAAAAAGFVPIPLNVTAESQLAPVEKSTVRSPMDSFVRVIHVSEGDWVEQGAVLAELATAASQKQLERREAEVAHAESDLKMVMQGAREEEILRLKAILKGKERALELSRREKGRIRQLYTRKLASSEELANAEQDLSAKQSAFAEAQAELKVAMAGSRPEEVEKRKAELRARIADRDLVKAEIAASLLKSPIAGVVTTPLLKEKLNSRLTEGAVFCDVEDVRSMRVVAKVPERDLDAVAKGQAVSVKVSNLPARVFLGTVSFVSPTIEEDPATGFRFFRIETVLENPDGQLKPNLSGFAKVHAGQRPLFTVVTRRIVRWLRLRFLL